MVISQVIPSREDQEIGRKRQKRVNVPHAVLFSRFCIVIVTNPRMGEAAVAPSLNLRKILSPTEVAA